MQARRSFVYKKKDRKSTLLLCCRPGYFALDRFAEAQFNTEKNPECLLG
jgi:hypothetical protein